MAPGWGSGWSNRFDLCGIEIPSKKIGKLCLTWPFDLNNLSTNDKNKSCTLSESRAVDADRSRLGMQTQRPEKTKESSLKRMGVGLIQRGFSPQVLTEQISKVLAEAILDGALTPGTKLLETELQQQLGISRSPLREAFRDLEKKGLVVILPRRGTFVREITPRDVQENLSRARQPGRDGCPFGPWQIEQAGSGKDALSPGGDETGRAQ